MNWEAFGSIAELLGAIAVVVSLFYVGRQVQISSKAVKAQSFQDLSMYLAEYAIQTNDNGVIDIMTKAVDAVPLTDAENTTYSTYILAYLRHASSAFNQFKLGLITEQQFLSLTHSTRIHITTEAGSRIVEQIGGWHDREFIDYLSQSTSDLDRQRVLVALKGSGT